MNVGRSNMNGLPYNPVTLTYLNSNAGQKLKNFDDDAKVRAFIRAQNLDTRNNCGHNPLNGNYKLYNIRE